MVKNIARLAKAKKTFPYLLSVNNYNNYRVLTKRKSSTERAVRRSQLQTVSYIYSASVAHLSEFGLVTENEAWTQKRSVR